MATTFLLIRHAAHGLLGKVLAGRMPGATLGPAGTRQAAQLSRRLQHMRLSAVQASPLERTQQTAELIALPHGLAVETAAALNEVDFGVWSGKRFDVLDPDPCWRRWNAKRATARCPGGESMSEVQDRLLAHLRQQCDLHPRGCVALVSHCDPIKAVLLQAMGGSLDDIHSFDIAPASVSTVVMDQGTLTVVDVNERLAA